MLGEKISVQLIELQINKIERSQNLTSKHRAVRNMQIAKTFSEIVNEEVT